jgi:hypothetical protein
MAWSIVVLLVAEFAFVGFLFWLFMDHRVRRERIRAEERERLLARFTTGQELSDFLSSPGGEKLFNAQPGVAKRGSRTLIAAVVTGMLLLFMGIGFFLMGWMGNPAGDRIFVPAWFFTLSGLCVLTCAAVSAFLLRRFGLLPRNGDGRGTDQP